MFKTEICDLLGINVPILQGAMQGGGDARLAATVSEAGGLVSDFSGGHNYLNSGNVVAGSPKVFKNMLQTIRPFLEGQLNA